MSEPLVLLPGMMCDAHVWATQTTVMSYERPVLIGPVWTVDRIEEAASGLLSMLPPKFALCGHGMGGAIALELLRRAPERVIRLALLGTNPLSDTPKEAADREPRIVGAKAGRFEDMLETEIVPRYVGSGPRRDVARNEFSEMALSLGSERFVKQERTMQRRRDQQGNLQRIMQPTLILAGDEDQIVPLKRQEFLAELIPYAELTVLEGVGHMSMLEDPDGVSDALSEWMRQPLVLR